MHLFDSSPSGVASVLVPIVEAFGPSRREEEAGKLGSCHPHNHKLQAPSSKVQLDRSPAWPMCVVLMESMEIDNQASSWCERRRSRELEEEGTWKMEGLVGWLVGGVGQRHEALISD